MTFRDHPAKLFVEVTTRCNLRCGMCVKQNGLGGIPEGAMPAETFERLSPAFPNFDSLVLNGIGEPLLHPHLEAFIARAISLMPEHAASRSATMLEMRNLSRIVISNGSPAAPASGAPGCFNASNKWQALPSPQQSSCYPRIK
ncbi:MAG: hypothetical protein M0Z89_09205 [Nitrospiraceae bacterium]|nr:hypothetical protein [Nitrospiraceae bacterium]